MGRQGATQPHDAQSLGRLSQQCSDPPWQALEILTCWPLIMVCVIFTWWSWARGASGEVCTLSSSSQFIETWTVFLGHCSYLTQPWHLKLALLITVQNEGSHSWHAPKLFLRTDTHQCLHFCLLSLVWSERPPFLFVVPRCYLKGMPTIQGELCRVQCSLSHFTAMSSISVYAGHHARLWHVCWQMKVP